MKVLPMRFRRFFWIIRIIVYCLKISGLAPISVGTLTTIMNSHRKCIRTFRFSKFGLVYNFLLLGLSVVIIMLASRDWFAQSFKAKPFIAQSITVIRTMFRAFSAIVIIISWTFRQRNAARIMNGILEIEVQIFGLRKQPSNKRFLILLTVHVIINAFTWITLWVTDTSIILSSDRVYNFASLILSTGSAHVIYWFTVQYFVVVGGIARDLDTVNENLLNLEETRNSCVSLSPCVNDFLQAFSSQIQNSQLTNLRSLIGIRNKLTELTQDVEDFFSFPILLCSASSFFGLVSDIHSFILRASKNTASIVRSFHYISWIFVHAYPIISLSANVTKTEKQAKLTAQVAHKVLAKTSNPEIKAELEKFSVQLIHDDFRFTAYGFFSLDHTLLHSMLGATTTYLVILLQFQSSDTQNA